MKSAASVTENFHCEYYRRILRITCSPASATRNVDNAQCECPGRPESHKQQSRRKRFPLPHFRRVQALHLRDFFGSWHFRQFVFIRRRFEDALFDFQPPIAVRIRHAQDRKLAQARSECGGCSLVSSGNYTGFTGEHFRLMAESGYPGQGGAHTNIVVGVALLLSFKSGLCCDQLAFEGCSGLEDRPPLFADIKRGRNCSL